MSHIIGSNSKPHNESDVPLAPDRRETDIHFMARWIALCLYFTLIVAIVLLPATHSSNDRSRWGTVWSLTHGHGYVIDESPYTGVDTVMRDGHHYSSKPPLLPTVIAGCVAAMGIIGNSKFPEDAKLITTVVLILLNVLPLCLMIIFYGKLLARWGYDTLTSCLCLFTAAFGTYLASYSVTLNNHTVSACSYFFTLYCLIRIQESDKCGGAYFLLTGLLSSWTVLNELPSGVVGVMTMWILFRKSSRLTLTYFVPGAMLVAGAYCFTTYLATGSLIPNYLSGERYQYEGSYWSHPQGIDALNEPKWFYALNLLIGHHGFFSLSPVLIFSVLGIKLDRERQQIHQITVYSAVALLIFLVFRTNNYGGGCQGPRWAIWIIPGLLLGMPAGIAHCRSKPWFLPLFLGSLFISLFSVFFAMKADRGPWDVSWLHLIMRTQGIIHY